MPKKRKKKLFAFVSVLTVAVMMVAPVVQGVTVEELMEQINSARALIEQLTAQLNQLQGQTTTPSSYPACVGVTFSRNLKQGMTGDDVKCLQQVLNGDAATQVAASGAGSPGNETTYFGALTKAAVVKFQEKYAAEVLTPLGLTAGTGFVGSATRTKLNALLGAAPGVSPAPVVSPAPGVSPVPTAGLTVTLASDTPASGTLVAGQGVATLAKFTFTNGNATEAKVTNLKLKRLGVSADATLTNVYLFDGATRLTDAASVSSGVVTLNDPTGLFKVGAGASKTIAVKSDIASGANGQTVGVGILAATDVTTDAGAVNGTFPLNGNLMSIALATLATVDFANTSYPSASEIPPQNDYALWYNSVNVGNRAVTFTRVAFREIGTINYTDLQNFRLLVDGVQVGSAVANLDANGYVTFDLSAAPKRLEAGTRTIKVLADIIGGSSRTASLSLRVAGDVEFTDTEYGVTVLPTKGGSTFSAITSGSQQVMSGVVTITRKTDSPSGKVVNAASNVLLGKFEVKAAGERVKIENLNVAVDVGSNANPDIKLRNGRLLANGAQVGSTKDIYDISNATAAYTNYDLGSSLIVEPGNPVTLDIYADIYNATTGGSSLDTTDDTITVRIAVPSSSNAQGLVSLASLTIPSTIPVYGNTLTNSVGDLTLSKYTAYPDYTAVPPVTAYKLAEYTLTADTADAVNVNTITVGFTSTDAFDPSSDLSNLYVAFGTNVTTTRPTVDDSTNSWTVNYSLTAGQTVDVSVYADAASSATNGDETADTCRVSLTVVGTTVTSGSAVSKGPISGQLITFGSGTFSAVAMTDPIAAAVASGETAGAATVTAAKFKFTALSDSFTINEVKVQVGAGVSGALINAVLKDGSTVLGTKPFDTSNNTIAYFTGLSVAVPANTNKTLTVDLVLSAVSADISTSQVNAAVTLNWYKYSNSQGTQITSTDDDYSAVSGRALYLYRSVPTFTFVDTTNTTLSNNVPTPLYKFKVKADARGDVALKQLKFNLALTDSSNDTDNTLQLSDLTLLRGSTDITSLVRIQDASGNVATGTTTPLTEADTSFVVTWLSEEVVPAGTEYTYTIKGTPGNFASSANVGDDTLSISLAGDTTSHNGSNVYLNAGTTTTDIVKLYSEATANANAVDYNVIWSDYSAGAHPAVAGTVGSDYSYDWANGYLILDLPLDGESWRGQ